MTITATHIAYYHICKRKVWLFSNGILMEHTSDAVYEGKMIGENSYQERSDRFKEIELDGVKIDFYDAKNKVVHEVKKSNKKENAHIAQVKYYLFKLEQHGILGATGVLEYPKLKIRHDVMLEAGDYEMILGWEKDVLKIIESEICPNVLNSSICKMCSYYDFCYVGE